MKNKIKYTLKIVLDSLIFLYNVSKIMFVSTILLVSLSGACTSIKLIIWKNFIDIMTIIISGNRFMFQKMMFFLILHLLISSVQILISQIKLYIYNIYSKYVEKSITDMTLTKVEKLKLSQFENTDCYNVIQKVNDESHTRSMSILETVIQIVEGISTSIGTVIVLFNFSKASVILCLLSSIPIFFFNNKIMNKWFEIFNQRYEKIRFANFLKNMCVKYENLKEFKIFDSNIFLKTQILNIYNENIKQDKLIRKRFLKEMSFVNLVDQFMVYLIKGIIIYFSILKKISIGSLVTYIQSIDILKESTNSILSMCSQAYEDSLYMDNFFLLMNISTNDDNYSTEFNSKFEKIKFVNVSFMYPNTTKYAISNFTYTFEANKTYGLVGLNGSGKTTLLKILLGLYENYEGLILVDGIDMRTIDKNSYYKCISAIFQDFIRYPFDVRTNIAISDYSKEYQDFEIKKAAEFSKADEFIEKLPEKYKTRLQKEWSDSVELSMGQWQKISISRATLKKASVLILDEPTASIDALAEFEMFNNFKHLSENKLCILVTHRLSNIKIADEIIVLNNGCLIECGTHIELMENNHLYKKLFNMQANAYQIKENIT